METGEWEEGEDELTHYLHEESPRVSALPVSIRYRAFASPAHDSALRAGRSLHDVYLYRRRRLDAVIEAELSSSGVAVLQPLQSVLTDPFAIAQRQQATYQWMAQRHSAEEILHRFTVDRRLTAAPCLAAVNRALGMLGREGGADAVMDVLEDVLLDNEVVPLSTLLEAIKALPGRPVHAARVALTFKDTIGTQKVPSSVWGNLAAALGQTSLQLPRPIEDHFMNLFERILAMVRLSTGRLSEALVSVFGRCLLSSSKPLAAAVRLVREELLSGRSRDLLTSSPLHLGAFLSDLTTKLCEQDGCEEGRVCGGTSEKDPVRFASDVIRYAHTAHLQLTPRVFEAVLVLCEQQRDYTRMPAFLASMCVLSTPTMKAVLRVAEVAAQLPELRREVRGALHQPCSQFFLWCLQRFPVLYQCTVDTAVSHRATERLFAFLGIIAVEDGWEDGLRLVLPFFTQMTDLPTPAAAAGVCAVVERLCVNRVATSAPPPTQLLLHQHEALLRVVLQLPPSPLGTASIERPFHTDDELRRLLPSEGAYGTVLSAAALATLASSSAAEQAYTRMMDGYQRKSGAVALVPFECICEVLDRTPAALPMLRRWQRDLCWFTAVPLAMTMALEGRTADNVWCGVAAAVKVFHAKVLLICGEEAEAAVALAAQVEPVIVMDALVRRLTGG